MAGTMRVIEEIRIRVEGYFNVDLYFFTFRHLTNCLQCGYVIDVIATYSASERRTQPDMNSTLVNISY